MKLTGEKRPPLTDSQEVGKRLPMPPGSSCPDVSVAAALLHSANLLAISDVIVAQAVKDLMDSKAVAGRSANYLRTLRTRLGHFSKGRARQHISSITPKDTEEWLALMGALSSKTWKTGC